MKCAYEAANGVEAHMIANLLEQVGIETRIDGEHLAGGVGELPAAGLVRVMVEEHRYDRARKVIQDWERTSTSETPSQARPRSTGVVWFVLGAGVTIAIMAWVNRPEVDDSAGGVDTRFGVVRSSQQGPLKVVDIDWDSDGRVDRHERYLGANLVSVTMLDPNGNEVKREYYDRGILSHAEYDADADGVLETRYRYDRYGEIAAVTAN